MKMVLAHTRVLALGLVRVPGYWIPTLIFPVMLFSFFGLPPARTSPQAGAVIMASFSAFAVIGISFYQFGVGIAQERTNPWESYVRTLPVSSGPRMIAQVLVAMGFAVAAAGLVIGLTVWGTELSLPPARWAGFALALLGGTIPFTMMGIAIGYLAPPRAALPIANLLHLPLTFAGGLWMRPRDLPEFVQVISPYVPTRHMGEIVWASVLGLEVPYESWMWLAGYTVLFAIIALWARARDEGERFT
jgi:ABC-2 type transport system permease protein